MSIRDLQFEKVPEKLRDELKKVGPSNQPNPIVEDLMKGTTLWVQEENAEKLAGLYQSARLRKYQMTMRKVKREVEGKEVVGHILWWTKKEEESKGATV